MAERTRRPRRLVAGMILLVALASLALPPIDRCGAQASQHPAAAAVDQPALQSQPETVELPTELARILSDYEAAWSSKDAAALAALFAEDGFVLSAGAPPVRGRAAIRAHYTGQGGPLALRAWAYAVDGSVGYIIGGFALQAGQPDIGKFTLTLRKGADARWLIVSDMDNPNAPR